MPHRFFVVLLTLTLFSCADGGGCSGCASDTVAPIPGGYPVASRIENAVQVRVTDKGLGFVEDNFTPILTSLLPTGLDIPFTKSTVFSIGPVDVTICDDNDCSAHVEIVDFELGVKAPSSITLAMRIKMDSRDASGPPGVKKVWDGTCDVGIDTTQGARPDVGIVAEISLVPETEAARKGYTRLKVESIDFDASRGIEGADLSVSGGFLGACGAGNIGFFKDFVLRLVTGPLTNALQGIIDDQLCTSRGMYGCPAGTNAVPDEDPMSTCRYGTKESDRCVPLLLGTDGQGDFGKLALGSISPGSHAYAQYLVAAGGAGEAVANGLSVYLYGGLRGTDATFASSPANHACVPPTKAPALPSIERAAVFRGNTIPGSTTASHVGIGIAEGFLDHAGYGLFDSGLACIAASTRLSQQLSTGLFSVLVRSLGDLAFPNSSAPMAITLRPQVPPSFEVGAGTENDPLLLLSLPELAVDFYVWSNERYIRFMTFEGDISVALDVMANGSEIQLAVGELTVANETVTNSEILKEEPEKLSEAITTILTSFAGQLLGALPPFTLPEFMGFKLIVPEDGILGVEQGTDEFLAIFADLKFTPPSVVALADTEAEITRTEIDSEALSLDGFDPSRRPVVYVAAQGLGRLGAEFEYGFRVDGGPWSRWSANPDLVVDTPTLMLQARHVIEVRSRIVGAPETTDLSPAPLEVVVDALAPRVLVDAGDDSLRITASDLVAVPEELTFRVHHGGQWSDWLPLSEGAPYPLPSDGSLAKVEVRDPSGNVGRTQVALVRGLPKGSTEGCGCAVPGTRKGAPGLASMLVLGFLALVFARRRRRRGLPGRGRWALWLGVVGLALGAMGCSCGSDGPSPDPCDGACEEAEGEATQGSTCCASTRMCVAYDLDALCDNGFICDGIENVVLGDSCTPTCASCVKKPPVALGDTGTYMDAVSGSDRTLMVSGYSAGSATVPLGDLVVGPYREDSMSVDWEILEGAPDDAPITNDPDGWRGGVSAAGPDVGRWTSIAEAAGVYYVTYYDVDNRALKIAIGAPGAWKIHEIDRSVDAGRYGNLLVSPSGSPTVAYLRVDRGDMGVLLSSVVVATASGPTPTSEADWTKTIVASAEAPCRAGWCAEGETCSAKGPCVTPGGGCDKCADGLACVAGVCEETIDGSYVEDMPPVLGLYPKLAATASGLALVYYDRTAGNIMGVSFDGTDWAQPFLIDGYGKDDDGVGDSGAGADLFVDGSGVWHVTYVDGTEETLRYATVDGMTVQTEVVDNGTTHGAGPHADGRHLVGDDSAVYVTTSGEVRIAYQDATTQEVILATRATAGGPWGLRVLDGDRHTGFFLRHLGDGTTSRVATWWKGPIADGVSGIRLLSVK